MNGRVALDRLDHLDLPAHIEVWAQGSWHPAWLIASDHKDDGWYGLVQYEAASGPETTEWVSVDRIAPAGDLPPSH
ncbi:hypothetical protein ACFVWG_36560 [Kribbella sp. NPDC058245]|uniref:hypothetical protein n=1 Tax=Kribbella sp. NPDC058245 TaxID=3346399 RepID=UPI0036EABBFD